MNEGDLAVFAREALIILLKLTGPVLLVGLVVGLAVSMLQALTQINEHTLVFIPKLHRRLRHHRLAGRLHDADPERLHPHGVRPDHRDRPELWMTCRRFCMACRRWAFGFMLVIARVGTTLLTGPGLGEAEIPPTVRIALAAVLAALVYPVLRPLLPPLPDTMIGLAGLFCVEIIVGAWLGLLTRVLVMALSMAGGIISYMVGLSSVLQIDPSHRRPGASPGTGAGVGGHRAGVRVRVVRAAGAGRDRQLSGDPAGRRVSIRGGAAQLVTRAVGDSFALALRLAAPFVVVCIVWQAALAFVSRLVPNIQVHLVSQPAQILGGLMLLAAVDCHDVRNLVGGDAAGILVTAGPVGTSRHVGQREQRRGPHGGSDPAAAGTGARGRAASGVPRPGDAGVAGRRGAGGGHVRPGGRAPDGRPVGRVAGAAGPDTAGRRHRPGRARIRGGVFRGDAGGRRSRFPPPPAASSARCCRRNSTSAARRSASSRRGSAPPPAWAGCSRSDISWTS